MCNETQQIKEIALDILQRNLIPLPDATTLARCATEFRCKWTKRRTDRITKEENVLYLNVRMMREWRLSCYKRIIREKDAKEIFKHSRTEVAQLLITKKADIQILNILGEVA